MSATSSSKACISNAQPPADSLGGSNARLMNRRFTPTLPTSTRRDYSAMSAATTSPEFTCTRDRRPHPLIKTTLSSARVQGHRSDLINIYQKTRSRVVGPSEQHISALDEAPRRLGGRHATPPRSARGAGVLFKFGRWEKNVEKTVRQLRPGAKKTDLVATIESLPRSPLTKLNPRCKRYHASFAASRPCGRGFMQNPPAGLVGASF